MKEEEYKKGLNTMLDVVFELEGLVRLALGNMSDNATFSRLIKSKLAILNSIAEGFEEVDLEVEKVEDVEKVDVIDVVERVDEVKGFDVEPEETSDEDVDDERTPVFTAAELRRSIEEGESTKPDRNITSYFSINDNFRFRRELFGNSASAMKMALESVSELQTYSDAEEFFYEELQWDRDFPVVQEFMSIIERYFQK